MENKLCPMKFDFISCDIVEKSLKYIIKNPNEETETKSQLIKIMECEKENCSWWLKESNQCSIPDIADRLDGIWNLLYEVEKSKGMP